MSAVISRVFMNGNSQAVRIPQEFRLDASRVEISRNEHGDLVIHPVPADRGTALLQALNGFDDELGHAFAEALEEDRRTQPALQEREGL
ncbi:antitoxin [Methylibium sp.]|uniref:antitoxin n=1 Tax=Methylibium sp. TaxID=2067992 RepID=UPI001798DB69|nr:AbrB/MazE/SpoVT family DNA-binding domain-containing protein [Methylibium sp.]MBA3590391.1 AbrB/MazE/SpoVT family DNA-binding domain-containing protein [Methylibium sp.]